MAFDLGNGNTENKLKALAESVAKALENAGGAPKTVGYIGTFTVKTNNFQSDGLAVGEMATAGSAYVSDNPTLSIHFESLDGINSWPVWAAGIQGSGDNAIMLFKNVTLNNDMPNNVIRTRVSWANAQSSWAYVSMDNDTYENVNDVGINGGLKVGETFEVYLLPHKYQ
ncbi:hypothetical protein RQY88_000228 [Vibrio vulnificus]|nr:hypothetical protein [Vibrio vulnificus]ELH9598996.1 hypothetical protein [Vibrio vulnificus]ELH9613353.1 hypothetical protein [Vibrio vulnificus]ELV8666216.1 hypothetical protein [Vibrio vulnificus]ELV8746552.1 hypothetical protein [Vibrio vulnificus]